MKNRIFAACLGIVFMSLSFAQDKELRVYLNEAQFYSDEVGTYIEIQLNFTGYTLNYITEEGNMFGQVEIVQTFTKGDSVYIADHYLLNSPFVVDSIVEDFLDIQRYPLEPGVYDYMLIVGDVNSSNEALKATKKIEILDFSDKLSFSSFVPAELIVPNPKEFSIYTRYGYDVVPMLGNYYPTELENLLYYIELYHTNTIPNDSIFLVEQKLYSSHNQRLMDEYTLYYRYKSSDIQPISKVLDISMLPTGSYTLELSVLDRSETVLARTSFTFDRNNSDEVNEIAYNSVVLDPAFLESIHQDSTDYYVASLIPISRQAEVKNILSLLKEKDNDKNIKYLQAFWLQINNKDPFGEWIRYKAQVQLVERLYSTNYQAGFETDRGRVYLQYGSPNSIIEEPSSPSEYPYEIWRYDRINQYSNRRFIFYNPTNLTGEYRLLHSDMIGELQNHRWQYVLNKRNTPGVNLDDPTGGAPDHFGGNSSRYYNTH